MRAQMLRRKIVDSMDDVDFRTPLSADLGCYRRCIAEE